MEREFKHTPGEWVVKHSESKPAYNVIGTRPGSLYKIARCPYYVHEPMGQNEYKSINERNKSESEANAKLIAAAPELLEALNFIVNCIPEPGEDAVLNIEGYNKACAAINKATS